MQTKTHPGPWFDESEATIMTVVQILERNAKKAKGNGRKRR